MVLCQTYKKTKAGRRDVYPIPMMNILVKRELVVGKCKRRGRRRHGNHASGICFTGRDRILSFHADRVLFWQQRHHDSKVLRLLCLSCVYRDICPVCRSFMDLLWAWQIQGYQLVEFYPLILDHLGRLLGLLCGLVLLVLFWDRLVREITDRWNRRIIVLQRLSEVSCKTLPLFAVKRKIRCANCLEFLCLLLINKFIYYLNI